MVSKYLKVLNISFAIQITLFDVGMNEDGEMQFVKMHEWHFHIHVVYCEFLFKFQGLSLILEKF
jgi:hypothetical protein